MVNEDVPEIVKNQMKFMKSRKKMERVNVNEITVDIQPYMFPPRSPYSYSTRILLDSLSLNNQRVLEVGVGCGVLSIFAAKQGASYVDGVDILSECVECSKKNALINGVFYKTNFYLSDMFSDVRDKYDTIICNLPILNGELPDGDPCWYSLFDPEFKFHRKLFREGKNYSSRIIIAHADLTRNNDFNHLEDLAKQWGWDVFRMDSKIYCGHEWRGYEFGRVGND